jgi:hypothetical protein
MPIRLDRDTELIRRGVDSAPSLPPSFSDLSSAKAWLAQLRPDGLAMLKVRALLSDDLNAVGSLTDDEVLDQVAWRLADGRYLLRKAGETGQAAPASVAGSKRPSIKTACDQAYRMSFDCSDLVWRVWTKVINDKDPKREANALIDYLEKESTRPGSGWSVVSIGRAYELVNTDVFVIAGARKSPHGHVVVLYPGLRKPDGGFRFTNKEGESVVARRHGTFPRCVSRSSGKWPGANSDGDKTVRDPWDDKDFKQVKYWAYQPWVRAGESKEGQSGESGPPKDPGDLPWVPPPPPEPKKTWVEVQLLDMEDKPVKGAKYILKDGDVIIAEGSLDANGCARVDNLDPGSYNVNFPEYDRDVWERK